MKKTIKLISILLVIFTALSLFSSCEKRRKKGDPPVFTSDKTVVMKMGDYNVKKDFYRYLFLNSKALADKGDESYWEKDGNSVDQIKDEVLTILKEKYAMFTLADKYDVALSEEEKLEIQANIKDMKSQYGSESEFKKDLENAYMTDELLQFTLEVETLNTAVYEHMISESTGIIKASDSTVEDALKTEFAAAKHILIKVEKDDNKEDKLKTAEEALARVKAGEDFDALISEYSKDTNVSANKYGYYFTHGEFKNEFEYTAFKLNIGEYSEIIETKDGYHIVKRVAMDDRYINDNFETLRRQYLTAKYYEMLNEVIESLEYEYQGEYVNITLNTFA